MIEKLKEDIVGEGLEIVLASTNFVGPSMITSKNGSRASKAVQSLLGISYSATKEDARSNKLP